MANVVEPHQLQIAGAHVTCETLHPVNQTCDQMAELPRVITGHRSPPHKKYQGEIRLLPALLLDEELLKGRRMIV